MLMRTVVTGLLALAAVASAQSPAGGRGWMGRPPGGPDAGFLGAGPGRPGRVVKGAPYTADMATETTRALPDGNRIHQTVTSRFYRDSEGRTRREQSLNGLRGISSDASQRQLVVINDPVAGVNYSLDPASRTGTKMAVREMAGQAHMRQLAPGQRGAGDQATAAPRMAGSRHNQNVKTEALGRQTIEGVQADGTRATVTIPAGQMGNEQPMQIVTETWYSADLQTVVLSKRTDPFSGETVTRLTNISRSEPLHSLFEAPSDFKITERAGRGPQGGAIQ